MPGTKLSHNPLLITVLLSGGRNTVQSILFSVGYVGSISASLVLLYHQSLFSVVGIIVNEKRAALDPHNVDKIIFLHNNSESIHLDYQRLKKKCKCDACLASESEID